jgi:carbamoyl-phosphate synthase small subunit
MPGLSDVDTRSIALRIRSLGAVVGVIGTVDHADESLVKLARSKRFSAGQRLVDSVTGDLRRYPAGDLGRGRAAIVDLGVKESIVSSVRALGVDTAVFGTQKNRDGGFDADAILEGGFDFVVLSNGPGDPTDIPGAITSTQKLIGQIPILGICLGHQITALALGAKTFKLKFGHRGANQPVLCHDSKRMFVTSQNHGYAVGDDLTNLRPDIEITYSNLNDGTIEGFRCTEPGIECVQFHPEASPGPHDSSSIFVDFFERVKKRAVRPADCRQNERMGNVQPV